MATWKDLPELKVGDKGAWVYMAQAMMPNQGLGFVRQDGIFDQDMAYVLGQAQRLTEGLEETGRIGPNEWELMAQTFGFRPDELMAVHDRIAGAGAGLLDGGPTGEDISQVWGWVVENKTWLLTGLVVLLLLRR